MLVLGKFRTNNMKCTWPTWPTRIEPLHTQRELYSIGSRWVFRGWRLAFEGWRRVPEAFQIPTCWYRQCELFALGAVPNVKTQHKLFRVAVEYRLKAHIPLDTGFALTTKSTQKIWNVHAQRQPQRQKAQRHLYSTDWHRIKRVG